MEYTDKEVMDECNRRPKPNRWAKSALYYPPAGKIGISRIGIFKVNPPKMEESKGVNPYEEGTKHYDVFECYRSENRSDKKMLEKCIIRFLFPNGMSKYFPEYQMIFV